LLLLPLLLPLSLNFIELNIVHSLLVGYFLYFNLVFLHCFSLLICIVLKNDLVFFELNILKLGLVGLLVYDLGVEGVLKVRSFLSR
jgi:hypothetical protein